MNLLLNDKFAPITKEIGFLECDLKSVATAYHLWMTEALRPYEMRIELDNIEGDLEIVLRNLLPLTTPIPCRFAFVPTQGAWTAYFDNGAQGTDSTGIVSVLSKKLNCSGLRVVFVSDTMLSRPSAETKGRFGATILEAYGSDGNSTRSIFAANDGGKWQFGQMGAAFPFEEMTKYDSKKIKDRFTGEMLESYLKNFGIAAFDEKFYAPKHSKPAILARKCGKLPQNLKEISSK